MDIIKIDYILNCSPIHTTITVSMIVLRIYAHFPNKCFLPSLEYVRVLRGVVSVLKRILNRIMNARSIRGETLHLILLYTRRGLQ